MVSPISDLGQEIAVPIARKAPIMTNVMPTEGQ